MQIRILDRNGRGRKGIKVRFCGHEGLTDENGIVNLPVRGAHEEQMFIDGQKKGKYRSGKDLEFTL